MHCRQLASVGSHRTGKCKGCCRRLFFFFLRRFRFRVLGFMQGDDVPTIFLNAVFLSDLI
jgi:hypothetical protein